jgi:hypothetical protein
MGFKIKCSISTFSEDITGHAGGAKCKNYEWKMLYVTVHFAGLVKINVKITQPLLSGMKPQCPELEFLKSLWGLGTEEE